MSNADSALIYRKYAIFQLWAICLVILGIAFIVVTTVENKQAAVTLVFSSLLLYAAGSSILNAIGKFMIRNLARSIPIFIVHAVLCFIMVKQFKPENGEALMNVYITILIFYLVITTLSIVFKAIYKLMSEAT